MKNIVITFLAIFQAFTIVLAEENLIKAQVSFLEFQEIKSVKIDHKQETKKSIFFEGIEPLELTPRENTKFVSYTGNRTMVVFRGEDYGKENKNPLLTINLLNSKRMIILLHNINSKPASLCIDVSDQAIPKDHLKIFNFSNQNMAIRASKELQTINAYQSELLEFKENEPLNILKIAIENEKSKSWRVVYNSRLDIQHKRGLLIIYKASNRAWRVLRVPWYQIKKLTSTTIQIDSNPM